ncbi:MAG: GNAT family N-acetyltransferase [Pseudomonadota bacterium]
MLKIRRIHDDILPVNRDALKQIKEILKTRFDLVSKDEIDSIGEKLRNPFKQRFASILFAAENDRAKVLGFSMLLYEPQINFCFLDWIAIAKGKSSGGLGGVLYERVREEAASLGVKGLFFECLPDDPRTCDDSRDNIKGNKARLSFYEQYGARPIIHTAYEAPVKPGETCMPHLVYDGLQSRKPLFPGFLKKVVRAILERKYRDYCPPAYVRLVLGSIKENPVQLREFRYVKPEAARIEVDDRYMERIALVVHDRHTIHHVHEQGYVESPVRIQSIQSVLQKTTMFETIGVRTFPEKHMLAVHDTDFVNYIRRACESVPEKKSIYPYIFPIRNRMRPPKEKSVLSGYYCIDTFTPINRNAYPAARRGVDCALTAAQEVVEGRRVAYALLRPPGHHAERRSFGGFCYFNNNAIAAQYLSRFGRIAILDIDYHHGNGQQNIFYRRADVLTVSIHGHPKFAYPYFSGFENETGEEEGEGFNLNLPLSEEMDGEKYRKTLSKALLRITEYKPLFLIVALGLDTAKGDPTGTWSLMPGDFEQNGRMIGGLNIPTIVIQEGGYRTRTLGQNAARFLKGLFYANQKPAKPDNHKRAAFHGLSYRLEPVPEDMRRVRTLMNATGIFTDIETEMAMRLLQDRLDHDTGSGCHFLLAEQYGRLIGFSAYGPVPCSVTSFKLYWIVIQPGLQGRGLGRKIILETEKSIQSQGGLRIYAETSERIHNASLRLFYERCGYRIISTIENYYADGEAGITYFKMLKNHSKKGRI